VENSWCGSTFGTDDSGWSSFLLCIIVRGESERKSVVAVERE